MNSRERNVYMDFLKGLAIIAVIVGHSLSNIQNANTLCNIIYSFHMPLLIFISAYVEEENKRKYEAKEHYMLLKRAQGLLIPYLSWTIIYEILSGRLWTIDIKNVSLQLFGYKQSGLWFLPVLFGLKFLHFLYWIIRRHRRSESIWIKDILLCAFLEIGVALLALLTKQPYIINMLSYAIPYFLAVVIVDYDVFRDIVNSEWVTASTFLIYMLLFPSFSFSHTQWTTQVIRIILALCVIIICCKFQGKWKINWFYKILCLFGSNSMAIYVIHELLMDYAFYFDRINSASIIAVLSILAAFIVAGVCIVIMRIIELSSWWKIILFGK